MYIPHVHERCGSACSVLKAILNVSGIQSIGAIHTIHAKFSRIRKSVVFIFISDVNFKRPNIDVFNHVVYEIVCEVSCMHCRFFLSI